MSTFIVILGLLAFMFAFASLVGAFIRAGLGDDEE